MDVGMCTNSGGGRRQCSGAVGKRPPGPPGEFRCPTGRTAATLLSSKDQFADIRFPIFLAIARIGLISQFLQRLTVSNSPRKTRRLACFAVALLIALAVRDGRAATEHIGQVTHNGVAVPGATVVATQGDKKLATSTNQQGLYRFAELAEGA